MLLASTVLRLVSSALQDLEPGMEKRWPWTGGSNDRMGLLDFLNLALLAVFTQRPDCHAVTESIRLETGMRQSLPSKAKHQATQDATGFRGLVRNMGTNGTTPGYGIQATRVDTLMSWIPTGDAMQRTTTGIDNYAYDRATNPNVYWVWPAPTTRLWVEATYFAPPTTISAATQDIGISEGYAQALAHHILAAIYAGDNEASNAQKAQWHAQNFQTCMDIKQRVDGIMPKPFTSMGANGV